MNLPVIHVSWNDAKAYVKWLARETGKGYRLPTEAELEYANRAGSRSKYPWGDGSPPSRVANLAGEKDRSPKGRTWDDSFKGYGDGYWGSAPVGSFKANGFGLHDTAGNVWEWAEDCWHNNYKNAPENGTAWEKEHDGDCGRRVLRGGTWFGEPRYVRSADRVRVYPFNRLDGLGFRLARTLK